MKRKVINLVEIENEYFAHVIKEMCNRVGADYDKLDPKKEDWYLEYSWTEKEQDDFKEWVVDYLYRSTGARKAILNFPLKNKTKIRKAVDWFLFDYGWTLKNES
jgi:hypothetical protein